MLLFLCTLCLFSNVFAQTCTLSPKACPNANFHDALNWDCGHVPTSLTNVVVSLSTACTVTVSSQYTPIRTLSVTAIGGKNVTFALWNASLVATSVSLTSSELSLVEASIQFSNFSSSAASVSSDGTSFIISSGGLDLSNLVIKTRYQSALTLQATQFKASTNSSFTLELPPVVAYEDNFTATGLLPQLSFTGAWNDTSGVRLVIYADASVNPEFSYAYPFIKGTGLSTLNSALQRATTLLTKFSGATFSLTYDDNLISLIYNTPGISHQPENALLSIPVTDDKYWVAVTWQGKPEGSCDPDLTFAGTELIFPEKTITEQNSTGTITYPFPYKQCDIIAFRSRNICTATINQDGRIVPYTTKSQPVQSAPILIVIPLKSPVNASNATISCELDKELYRNCTILLTVPPYDCECTGGEVSSYEFNITCSPLVVHNHVVAHDEMDASGNKLSLNCTASNFTGTIMYRAQCKWPGNPNAPQGTYHSDWSLPHDLLVSTANLTKGKLVPRAPIPLAVIIVSAILLAIGLIITAYIMIKRRNEFKYQSIN